MHTLRPLIYLLPLLVLVGCDQQTGPSVDSGAASVNATTGRVDGAALLAAVDRGDLDTVRRLIGEGADPDASVLGDGTALIQASRRGHLDIVDLLLRSGAGVDTASRGDGNPLIAASMSGHQDVAERLLDAGADANAVVAGDETPLINAARKGHLSLVELLVAHGADVNLGVDAHLGEWRTPLNQARAQPVRDYLAARGAVEDGRR